MAIDLQKSDIDL